jgi:hypothetical protein
MAFQKDCGDLIIDAVLTDVGRKKLIRGDLNIEAFTLGDDELDYSLLNTESCVDDYTGIKSSLVLEAYGREDVNIHYGLQSFPRDDFLYIPKLHINELLENSALRYKNRYYLAINEETVNKLKKDVGQEYILQNDKVAYKHIMLECGITFSDKKDIPKNFRSKKAYILNYELYDKYYYIHCDRRLIDEILVSDPQGIFKNTKSNRIVNTMQPLVKTKQINMNSYVEDYSLFRAAAVDNKIYKYNEKTRDNDYSVINGPRSSALALNFVCNQKLVTEAVSAPDDRFVRFGTTDAMPFPTNTRYDYIDTVILVEGTVTKSQIKFPVRIIRYRSG